jgi:Ran GTPase-activating protein (RanGAP) involved in mRNA processing and transport
MNVLVEDLVDRLSRNDPTLHHVSLRSLPLASVSAEEVEAVVRSLTNNTTVTTLDFWLPAAADDDGDGDTVCDNDDVQVSDEYDTIDGENALDGTYMNVDNEGIPEERTDTTTSTTVPANFTFVTTMLVRNTTIRHLVVQSACAIALQALFEGLSQNTAVQTLELGDVVTTWEPDESERWNCHVFQAAAAMFRQNKQMCGWTLRGVDWSQAELECSSESLREFTTAVMTNRVLQVVEWQDVVLPRNESTLLASLKNCAVLRLIDCDLSSSSGSGGLNSLLTGNTVTRSLRLIECQLGSQQCKELAVSLQHNSALQLLDLRGNTLTDASCEVLGEALASFSCLAKLILEDCQVTDEALQQLCRGLCENTSLQELNLRGNRMQTTGCEALADALTNNTTLRILDMSENMLNDTAASALARTATNSRLEVLRVGSTNLADGGVATLCRGLLLSKSGYLRELDLSRNWVQGQGATAISAVLNSHTSSSHLTALNLSGCRISDETAKILAKGLIGNWELKKLGLSFNEIGDAGAKAIGQALPNTQLVSLVMQFNALHSAGIHHLVAGLADNYYLQDLMVLNAQSYCCLIDESMAQMIHYLQLNRAGRDALKHNTATPLWPRILARADGVYGPDALYHLLKEQPDLVATANVHV